jgi:hypothetical protein
MPINVFLSVGRPFCAAQEAFTSSIEDHLKQNGFRPRTVGRSDFTHTKPLQLIDRLLDQCAAVLIVAFERTVIERGFDRRGSSEQTELADQRLPTPWNQIESALAYAKRLPILVVKEDGLRAEGLLEPGYDWYVHSTPLSAQFVSTPQFQGTFKSWSAEARKRAGWFGARA